LTPVPGLQRQWLVAAIAGHQNHPALAGPGLELALQLFHQTGRSTRLERELDLAGADADRPHHRLELLLELDVAALARQGHDVRKRAASALTGGRRRRGGG